MIDLKERVIVVTGAGAGIGLGIAKALASSGAQVFGCDVTPESAAVITAIGATPITADVSDPASLTQAVATARRIGGRLDGLVNNAGLTLTAPFLEAEIGMWDRLWQTNQRSVLVGCQAAARIMVQDGRKGVLLNVASVHSHASAPDYEGYAATKGAILATTRAMAWSLGPHGIRVNSLSPGLTMTEQVAKVAKDKATADLFATWHADGETASVTEMAQVATFLMSDASAALTGTDIVADHGTLAHLCDFGG
ncbi:SDR family NAD(P)-dependent oxidoreductase [Aestuariibius sp. HNIBRBA575]|uniref:SDR family NAD(P)-dependent oxidoreductase n=1 Tax=Aestuariibius sp. HNIBRBA575 TaxID=3233343 RepID=UPI0034A30CD8